ncbi:unnamed protein product, partial [Adineta ricciae]
MMIFELLPNEIVLECFIYLNAPDLFYAFDNLNNRFQQLIENIPLSVYCQDVRKRIFDQFCSQLHIKLQIKRNIYSLQLSNKNETCGQIGCFFSQFSLDEFDHLRSLILINVKPDEIQTLEYALLSLSNLSYFAYNLKSNSILNSFTLSLPNLRRLVLENFYEWPFLTRQMTLNTLTHVTITNCNDDEYYEVIQNTSMLKYLEITNLSLMSKKLPNLKILTLSVASGDEDLLDALSWQNLISSSLSHLRIFKFYFSITLYDENINDWLNTIGFNMIKNFENDFWTKQHHWNIAYQLEIDHIIVFTLPCMKYDCKITSHTKFSQNYLSMDHIMYLTLGSSVILNHLNTFFSNLHSLTFDRQLFISLEFDYDSFVLNLMEWIKKFINLSSIQRLNIENTSGKDLSSILIEIFETASHLSAISVYSTDLLILLKDDQLCQYFDKRITELTIREDLFYGQSFNLLKPIWEKFSNLKRLKCEIRTHDDLLTLLKQLPKLTNLSVFKITTFREDVKGWIEENIPE